MLSVGGNRISPPGSLGRRCSSPQPRRQRRPGQSPRLSKAKPHQNRTTQHSRHSFVQAQRLGDLGRKPAFRLHAATYGAARFNRQTRIKEALKERLTAWRSLVQDGQVASLWHTSKLAGVHAGVSVSPRRRGPPVPRHFSADKVFNSPAGSIGSP